MKSLLLRIAWFLVAVCIGLLPAWAQSKPEKPDESKEPPLKYTLAIGAKSMTVLDGQSVTASGEFKDPAISITAQPTRVFPYGGLSFNYPHGFTFEADLSDPSNKIWTLSGNDFKIMYFAMEVDLTPAQYAAEIINQIGKERCRVSDPNAKMTLGKIELVGARIRMEVVAHPMTMDVYRVPRKGKNFGLLVFQDSVDDSGKHSQEGLDTLATLKSSFSLNE